MTVGNLRVSHLLGAVSVVGVLKQVVMLLFSNRRKHKEFAVKEKLEIVIRAAPPHFQNFAGGFPRRRRRRNAFELIQEYCTRIKLSRCFDQNLKTAIIGSEGEMQVPTLFSTEQTNPSTS